MYPDIFLNYLNLRERVDDLCQRIKDRYPASLACGPGCDACCREISLFPVEALYIARYIVNTDDAVISCHAKSPENCPLLSDSRCAIYEQRPIICRTHGFPILYSDNSGSRNIDCCTINFTAGEILEGTAVIDVERLNVVLVSINVCFIAIADPEKNWPDRMTIVDAHKIIRTGGFPPA